MAPEVVGSIADPWNEMIDGAGGRVDGNARHRGPGNTVARCAVNQIVRGALAAKAAILPHHPNRACAIHGRRRQWAAANSSRIGVALNAGDGNRRRPAHASVGRGERGNPKGSIVTTMPPLGHD